MPTRSSTDTTTTSSAAARQFAPNGFDAALITAGGAAADKALTAMRAGGGVAYPNGVEPTPEPPSGIEAKSYDGMPDPQAIEKLNQLIESPGASGTGAFEVQSRGAFPWTKQPRRIARLMSTILASLSCKWLSRSHTGCATMQHRRVRHPALIPAH